MNILTNIDSKDMEIFYIASAIVFNCTALRIHLIDKKTLTNILI